MEWIDILRRIESGEDARTEFKSGLGDFSSIHKTLCAFANGDGGLLVVGVDDSGGIVGLDKDAETVQEKFTSFLQNGCGRPVTAVLGRQPVGSNWVHWIEVRRHQRGYEPFNTDGRYWIRRGRSTVAPSPSELQELVRARRRNRVQHDPGELDHSVDHSSAHSRRAGDSEHRQRQQEP